MRSFKEIVEKASKGTPVRLAVAAPYDYNTLKAVLEAAKRGMVQPNLYGCREKIESVFIRNGWEICGCKVFDTDDPILKAVDSIRAGENDVIMKGAVTTPALMSVCLSKTRGLNMGRNISSIVVCEIPKYGKLLTVSDPALNILPDLQQKIDITKNMIELFQAVEVENPKIALLSSMEEVSAKIPSSMDAAVITQMARRGQIRGGIVDGPLAFDNIISSDAAEKKGICSEVAGCADGIVVPNIECGNAIIKSFVYFADSCNACVIMGALAPVVLPSRAGKLETKLSALALGTLIAKRKRDIQI